MGDFVGDAGICSKTNFTPVFLHRYAFSHPCPSLWVFGRAAKYDKTGNSTVSRAVFRAVEQIVEKYRSIYKISVVNCRVKWYSNREQKEKVLRPVVRSCKEKNTALPRGKKIRLAKREKFRIAVSEKICLAERRNSPRSRGKPLLRGKKKEICLLRGKRKIARRKGT